MGAILWSKTKMVLGKFGMAQTILLVDDEPANIFTLQCILEGNDCLSESCDCGLKALDKIRNGNFDLVLLDIMLPDIDGYETCRRIKAINSNIPVVLVTALADNEDLKKGFEAGAIDYVKKPIDEIELMSRIKNVLRIKDAEKKIKSLYSALMHDLKLASRIQSYMLPKQFFIDDQLMFCSKYTPSTTIGGDLFDIIKISESKYIVYIGDISGHGIQAALLMSAVKSTINMLIEREDDHIRPSTLLNRLNSILSESLLKESYMTLLAGCIDLDENTFRYFNAGHPPVIEYDLQNHKAHILDSTGSAPIGWAPDIEYLEEEEGVLKLEPDKVILLYSDGIIESEDGNLKQLGIEGLSELLEKTKDFENCLLLPHKIKRQLNDIGYGISADDFSILTFQKISKNQKKVYFDLNQISKCGSCSSSATPLLANVGMVGSMCEEKIIEWTSDRDLAAKTEIVLIEFLNNVLIHGLKNKKGSVIVELSLDEAVRIRVLDDGIKWQPVINCGQLEDLFVPDDKYADSGRGMKMIQTLASSFTHNRTGKINETIIEMDRALSPVKQDLGK